GARCGSARSRTRSRRRATRRRACSGPAPIARAWAPASWSFDRGVADAALEGLAPGVRWLRAHRPAAGAPAICHGDFHPRNLLAEGGRVSAVLDWPNTVVTDPEYDVAATLVILRLVPIALLPVPAPLRPVVAAVRALMTARYLAAYRRARGLDRDRLDASRFGARLAARFARVSGVAVSLPPWRR